MRVGQRITPPTARCLTACSACSVLIPRWTRLAAALRVLADVGDPRADLRGGLITAEQFERVSALFGRGGTERVVIERALALESKLRSLERARRRTAC